MSSPEIMKRIAEAEKESRVLVDAAEHEVLKMKKDVPRRTASMREETLREAAARREKALIAAQQQGAEEAERIASQTQMRIGALSKITDSKRRQALEKGMALVIS